MYDTALLADTFRVIFRPAKNGTGLMCRLPSGKVAFPSRYFWNQRPPLAYEIWLVRSCGETEHVAYVKPLQRLAEAPLGQSRPAHVATAATIGAVTVWQTLGRLFRRSSRRPT
jgi:hypothetical protein